MSGPARCVAISCFLHGFTAQNEEDCRLLQTVPRLTRRSAGSVLLLAVLGCDGAASAALVLRAALSVLAALAGKANVLVKGWLLLQAERWQLTTEHVGDGLLTGNDFMARKEVIIQSFAMLASSTCENFDGHGDPC